MRLRKETSFRIQLKGGGWWDRRDHRVGVQDWLLCVGGAVLLDNGLTISWRVH